MDLDHMLNDPNEKPLDRLVTDGGFCGIFRTIGCIGDSLSSGELESLDENGVMGWHDIYDISWGQYIARMAGCKVYNFSAGGMSARWYLDSFAESRDMWNPDKACQAYIIALGVNDFVSGADTPVGSVDDICREDYTQNKDTFVGNFAKIMQRYMEIQPGARFFLVTVPSYGDNGGWERNATVHQQLMYDLAEYFDNTYVVDLKKYGPVYDGEFRKKFFVGGHMNTAGYLLSAKLISSYIDYIVRHNLEDFSQIGFVGTPYKYVGE